MNKYVNHENYFFHFSRLTNNEPRGWCCFPKEIVNEALGTETFNISRWKLLVAKPSRFVLWINQPWTKSVTVSALILTLCALHNNAAVFLIDNLKSDGNSVFPSIIDFMQVERPDCLYKQYTTWICKRLGKNYCNFLHLIITQDKQFSMSISIPSECSMPNNKQ